MYEGNPGLQGSAVSSWTGAARLLFVTGKGGAGKTTLSVALAHRAALMGQRVLLATVDGQSRLARLFAASKEPGSETAAIAPGISAVAVDPVTALHEYGTLTLKSRLLEQAVFGNRYVQSFFAAVPGLHQWAVLGKVWYHSTETRADGSPRFDLVVFDAPATGHAIEMLWVPKILTEIAESGPLVRDAQRAWKMLQDPSHTQVVIVTLPEETPVIETLELALRLRVDLDLSVQRVFVNGVIEERFTDAERDALLALDSATLSGDASAAFGALNRRAAEEIVQRRALERLTREFAGSVIRLPRLPDGVTNRDALGRLLRSP